MVVELINTGSELMLGRVLNTHQQWLCRQLADMGLVVSRQVAVADTGKAIEAAVREALSRADLVITTGGLGPTSDDITRDLIANMLGKALREDAAARVGIERFFASRNRPVPAGTWVESLVPEGATVLPNLYGTAPGLSIPVRPNPFRPGEGGSLLVMLPGPPRELRPMFTSSVVPILRQAWPSSAAFVCHTWRTTGLGESMVEEKVGVALKALESAGLELGYCARPGQVDVRLAARGESAAETVRAAEEIVRARLGAVVFGTEEDDLETVVIRLLTHRKQTLALAESCTGGFIAHRLTNVPGASAVVLASLVTYSNEAKMKFLGVEQRTLAEHGAVSEAVARQMAEGVRRSTGADYAVAVTGIAGPGGGSASKPVGTVFIALADAEGVEVQRQLHPWDRETFKYVTSQAVLDWIRRRLK